MDRRAKIVILGSCSSGKTSLAKKFVSGGFDPNQSATIGAAFQTKKIERDGLSIHLDLWDTAGQERYGAIAPLYYRDANAILIVYDITDKLSIKIAQQWCSEVRIKNKKALLAVFGNKTDLLFKKEETVPFISRSYTGPELTNRLSAISESAQRHFEPYDLVHFSGSAKTGEGIAQVFKYIANKTSYTEKIAEAPGVWCCI